MDTDIKPLINNEDTRDKYYFVYIIVFFTGMGTLIPWNFFITVKQYFLFQLSPNRTEVVNPIETTYLQSTFENYLSICSMLPLALINIANLFLRRYIRPMKRFLFGIIIMFIVFVVTLVFTLINTTSFILAFFIVTMVSVCILNVSSGLIQGSAMGIVSMLPSRYIKAFMEGQAISGFSAAIANIVTLSIPGIPVYESAFAYFIIALVILFITGVGFTRLGKLKFSRRYVQQSSLLDSEISIGRGSSQDEFPSNDNYSLTGSSLGSQISIYEKYVPIIKQIIWHLLSCALCFLVTLSLFPAILASIESTNSVRNQWTDKYFVPVSCFLFFNIADYLGRFLCGFLNIPSSRYPKSLFALCVLRVVFVPLFLLCNVTNKKNIPTLFFNDAFSICFTWIMGLTNGYLLTLSFMYAPKYVDDRDKEAVGTIMSLFMCLGLTLGVSLSFIFTLFM